MRHRTIVFAIAGATIGLLFGAAAMEAVVRIFSLAPAMAMNDAAAQEKLYYERDGHCTAAGHGVIARELGSFLVERNLVP